MFNNDAYPQLTQDANGYVYWRGGHVEHFSFGRDEAAEQKEVDELATKCQHLEALDVPVGPGLSYWGWFKTITHEHPYFRLLRLTPSFYEGNGGLLIIHNDCYYAICKGSYSQISLNLGDSINHYYALLALGYRTIDAGQRNDLGQMYSTLEGVTAALDRYLPNSNWEQMPFLQAPYIRFNYLYRDSGNNKKYRSVLFKSFNSVNTNEVEALLRMRLDESEYFIAEQIGLPTVFSHEGECEFDPDADHFWHEFTSLEEVKTPSSEDALDSRSFGQFLNEFLQIEAWHPAK
jgi:hypothetical protein